MTDRPVLVVGAHPDDEVLGVGGTIVRHADAGAAVHVLIVTEGTTAQYDDDSLVETKRRQARACANRLGVTEVHFGDLPDMRLDEVPHVDINAVIESVVAAVEPAVVYTHGRFEVNRDHVAVHDSTLVATRPGSGVERVLAYEVPSSTDWARGSTGRFQPTVYVDLGDALEKKIDAFREYDTETRSAPHPRSPEVLRARAQSRGAEAGFEAAEAFELLVDRRRDP